MWISSAALLDDGKLVAAAAEERFNRQKMSKVFPERAAAFCLKEAGLTWKDIDRVVMAWNPAPHIRAASSRYTNTTRWRGEYLANVPANVLRQLGSPDPLRIEERLVLDGHTVEILYVDHHQAHAASAFFLSPFESAAVLTLDGRGEDETTTLALADGNGIRKLRSVVMPHSIGLLYSTLTEYLGFKAHTDEWKVMALGSYGRPGNEYVEKISRLITVLDDGRFELDLSYFDYYQFDSRPSMFTGKLVDLLGPARRPSDPYEQKHNDIAWAMQHVFETNVSRILEALHRETGETRLVLAGGAAMNSVYNGKIAAMTPFKDVFIPSCPDDTGVSIGAALYAHHCLLGGGNRWRQTHNFWGPRFSDDEIRDTLDRYKITAERVEDIEQATAELLAAGKLVGWFQGRMEFGQRALGNRSILADPRSERSKELVNAAVKYREGFRPFAPAVLDAFKDEYFELPEGVSVPFMEKVFPVRPEKRDAIPAVVHVDGSGRLQTVDRETNPRFHTLIERFHALTGVPVVLNTSFNLNGEPVVCTPTDAIRTFYSCGLDALVLGNWLVRKN